MRCGGWLLGGLSTGSLGGGEVWGLRIGMANE